IRNMGSLKEIPARLDNDAYRPLFEMARFLNLSKKDSAMYTSEFKKQETVRLEKVFYGKEREAMGKLEGKKEGKKEKAEEIALGFYESGIEIATIANITGVPAKRIIQLSIEKGD
ncbi:MAG TPA: hypothetical protein VL053_16475, partial [Arachidicoccus sp.]|nr:hypothetical protein [Arachidicoccus sp.]